MIPNSVLIAGLATAGSIAVHGLILGFAPAVEPVRQTGGSPSEVALVGYGFADLVKGVTAPQPVETHEQPTRPVTEATVVRPETQRPVASDLSLQAPARQAPISAAQPAPLPTSAARAVDPTGAAGPGVTLNPVPPATSVLKPVASNVADPQDSTVEASLRPRSRTVPKIAPTRPDPVPKPSAESSGATLPGNARKSERRGSESASEQAPSISANNRDTRTVKTTGTASAANYPGQVFRKLSQTQRPRLVGRGSAQVAFSVAPNGGLAGLRLARSSGSSAIDAAALRHVRKSAPFPSPPPGAQRSFGFTFSVK